jgi:secondary thiamine-phosphate synthase enzyme
MLEQKQIEIATSGRSTTEITAEVEQCVRESGIQAGLCNVFIHHTSASLIITENADPTVRHDLEYFMSKQVIDGDPNYRHDMEGPDDMSAHIRNVLTQHDITVPVMSGRSALGTWQGIYFCEFDGSRRRKVLVKIVQD